jgi:quercetin dioxygenase-like cupin family protein
MSGSHLRFDLAGEIEALRGEPSFANGEPVGRTLVKESNLRIVLFAFPTGGCLREHDASGPVSLQALDGSFTIGIASDRVDLPAGSLLTLQPDVQHEVRAVDAGALLVTIGRTRYAEVSERHGPDGRSDQ